MVYVHRDEVGAILKLTRHSNGSGERLPDDHPEIVAYRNPVVVDTAQDEFEAAIAAATTIAGLKAAILGTNTSGKAIAGKK